MEDYRTDPLNIKFPYLVVAFDGVSRCCGALQVANMRTAWRLMNVWEHSGVGCGRPTRVEIYVMTRSSTHPYASRSLEGIACVSRWSA